MIFMDLQKNNPEYEINVCKDSWKNISITVKKWQEILKIKLINKDLYRTRHIDIGSMNL